MKYFHQKTSYLCQRVKEGLARETTLDQFHVNKCTCSDSSEKDHKLELYRAHTPRSAASISELHDASILLMTYIVPGCAHEQKAHSG